jgi:hypothetical protein
MIKTSARQYSDLTRDETDWMTERFEILKNRYPFDVKNEFGKLVLQNKRIKLVQINNTDEDCALYKKLLSDYQEFLNFQLNAGGKIVFNKENAFNEECVHEFSDKYPMFIGYDRQNNLVGMFGFRKSINITHNGKLYNFQELSARTYSDRKRGLSFYGITASIMLYTYALSKRQHVVMSTFPYIRDLLFHCLELGNYQYITSHKRDIPNLNLNTSFDIFATVKVPNLEEYL